MAKELAVEQIRIYKSDRARLDRLKLIPDEPYGSVLKRLLDRLEGKEDKKV